MNHCDQLRGYPFDPTAVLEWLCKFNKFCSLCIFSFYFILCNKLHFQYFNNLLTLTGIEQSIQQDLHEILLSIKDKTGHSSL